MKAPAFSLLLRRPRHYRLLCGAAAVCAALPPAAAAERSVFIMAGQSNALNWHAAAARLPADSRDGKILFYFETGAPPSRRAAVPFNATSGGNWSTLQPQRQDPFVRYERDFFGPEMTLARQLARSVATPVAIIKVAYFGTTLAADWQPDATAGNQLHARLRDHLKQAVDRLHHRGETARIAGFFWMQGETDGSLEAHATAYQENLRAFIARVRTDCGEPALPFVLGRVGPRPARGYAFQDVVRRAQVSVAETVPNVAWVDTDDLPRDTDQIHLLAEGVMTLGEQMATAWLRLRDDSPKR